MKNAWLAEFFSGDNCIDLNKVMTGQFGPVYQKMLIPLVEASSSGQYPIILPYNDGLLRFYATAQDERTLRELRRVLSVSLGTAYTKKELPIVRKATNSSERVLLNLFPSGLIQITLSESFRDNPEAKKWVFETLGKVLQLYRQRPLLVEDINRPVGRILREFFTACQVSDSEAAEELFQELKAAGSLSQRNLLFLNFQALATGKKWEEILENKHLTDCLNGRIPLQTKRILLKAISNRFGILLQEGFDGESVEEIREKCRVISPIFFELPNFKDLIDVDEEWQAWVIGAVVYEKHDLLSYIPKQIKNVWLDKLFNWAGVDIQKSLPKEQSDIIGKPDLDLHKVQELFKYSLVAPLEELPDIVLKISLMPEDVLCQIKNNHILHKYWTSLLKQYAKQDYGWNEWFTEVVEQEIEEKILLQKVIYDSVNWPSSSFDFDFIINIFDENNIENICQILRDVLPLLIKWFQDHGLQCKAKLWIKFLGILALDEVANKHDVHLAMLIIDFIINDSYSVDEYEESLQALEILFDKALSVKNYTEILNIVDLLLENSCPSNKSLKMLWVEIQTFCLKKWNRLSHVEKHITHFSAIEILGEEAEMLFANYLQYKDELKLNLNNKKINLSGKLLAIYSLTNVAARRAKEMIMILFPDLKIEINNHHVSTSLLENLAKTADFFIFSSQSAKHQAFYSVKRMRNDIIYPSGRGASSIVKSFIQQIESCS